jgi:type I restriction-modification system DNA methylase subunit
MALSWNEIKDRALKFSKDWEGVKRERAEKDTFWNEFFNVFGIDRRRVAIFEKAVPKLNGKKGFIDLFWKGTLLVEHKSHGKDLNKAHTQAIDYFPGIKEYELPKYILVCDFERFKLYDLDERTEVEFNIKDFHKNVKLFGFIAGYQKRIYKEEDPVNIKAAYLMGKLHDLLEESGYEGHVLEVYLVRLLFCLFADDTSIFEKDIFKFYLEENTKEDGSDLGAMLNQFFEVLNKPTEKRQKNLDESLNQFPYVNGKLFEEPLPTAAFNSKMREILLDASALNWGKISPAIFGSMFQSVMNPKERRDLGAHYTSEKNILKLIKPLFLDDLYAEFNKVKSSSKKLGEFHKKLANLKFLDPACGCGNFLVITYRELRLLELKILRVQHKNQLATSIESIIWIDVDQFYGIEYDEWPARIAEVALWLMDHQMNMLISEEFGQYFARLPLKKAAKIVNTNALKINWQDVIPNTELSYIIGNPPFYGKQLQTTEQKTDMKRVYSGVKGAGVMDYVSAWYILAAQYIQNTNIKAAFVSTNSIAQGEQVGILWNELFTKYGIKIHFAHRTFDWKNDAKGNAAVHVVIIGFANFDVKQKLIFDYEDIKGEPHEIKAKNINPYLVDAGDLAILKRRKPICNVSEISFGSMPNDGGNFLFTDEEKNEFLQLEPNAEPYLKPLLSAHEFLNGKNRWCLWLKNIAPADLRNLPLVRSRVEAVRTLRQNSTRVATQKLAAYPTLFGEIRQPKTKYVLIPRHSSENRKYIPMGFFEPEQIASDSCLAIDNATLYEFGVVTSEMHMAWANYICGRLESRYRYSNEMVYNNYPWAKAPAEKHKKAVEQKAQQVLDVRATYPNSSLADLYDPLTMPPNLVKAHQQLDKAVDLCYRPQPFTSETARIEFLFDLYNQYTNFPS